MRYARWGEDGAGKPPLVLSHATGFCGMVWRRLAEALSAAYDVYAIDRRGHGRSDKPVETHYDLSVFAADMSAFIEAVGLRDVYGVGHSGGASELLFSAAERPAGISRIFALEAVLPSAAEGSENPNEMSVLAKRRRAVWESREAVLERWGSRPPFGDWAADILRDYVEYGFEDQEDGSVRLLCPPELESRMFNEAVELDSWTYIERVECPVTFGVATRSEAVFARWAEQAAATIAGGQVYVFEGASHLIPMEMPERVVAQIVEFDSSL